MYTYVILTNCLNHLIDKIAQDLIKKKKIKKSEEILNFTIDDLNNIYKIYESI